MLYRLSYLSRKELRTICGVLIQIRYTLELQCRAVENINHAKDIQGTVGYIESNPLRGFEKPPAGQRDTVITQQKYE